MYKLKTFSSSVRSPSAYCWCRSFSLIKKLSSPFKKKSDFSSLAQCFQSVGQQNVADVRPAAPGNRMSPEKKSKERVLYICTFKIIMGINVQGGEKMLNLKMLWKTWEKPQYDLGTLHFVEDDKMIVWWSGKVPSITFDYSINILISWLSWDTRASGMQECGHGFLRYVENLLLSSLL